MSDPDPNIGTETPPPVDPTALPEQLPGSTPIDAPSTPSDNPSKTPPFTHTRASGFWAAVVVGLIVLLVLVIFILENGQRASVSFFGTHGHLPEGVALLLAAVIGGLFVVFAGAARILQLRTRARGQAKQQHPPQPRRAKRGARS
jgi:uncharacterized integral membrane protein